MLRICVLTTSFPRFEDDEAGIFVGRLVQAYSDAGASGCVIVPLDAQEPMVASKGNFSILRFRYGIFRKGALAFGAGIIPNLRRRPLLILQAPLLLWQLFWQSFRARKTYDILHANWTPAILAAWFLNLWVGKPYFVTLRGEDMNLLKMPLAGFFIGLALKRAKFIASVNQTFVSALYEKKLIPHERLAVIPNGVEIRVPLATELESFEKSTIFSGTKKLVFIGTVIPRKRIEVLLELLMLPVFKDHTLMLAGRLDQADYVSELQKLVLAKGLKSRVSFMGAVPPSQIPLLLGIADFYVTASSFEGRPNALLEALASGVAVVAADIPAHQEIVKDGVNGLLFNPERLADLEGKLQALAKNPQKKRGISTAARQSQDTGSWADCAKKYLFLAS